MMGDQLVPPMKSSADTASKKLTDWLIRLNRMPTVVSTDTKAQRKNSPRATCPSRTLRRLRLAASDLMFPGDPGAPKDETWPSKISFSGFHPLRGTGDPPSPRSSPSGRGGRTEDRLACSGIVIPHLAHIRLI